MKTTSHSMRSLPMRRLVAAIAVASGGAAVAGAVVLAERPAWVDAAMTQVAAPATHSPKDAWRRMPSPWASERVLAVHVPIDVSLPDAADALGAAAQPSEDAPPTF